MVLTFLGLTLVAGLYCTQKATTFREYAVGNKRFHTTTLVVTVLATVFEGGLLMREAPNVYAIGLRYILYLFAKVIHVWIISLLGLRMGPFMEHFSAAETIGSVYGKYPRAITAVLGICFSIGVVAIQINVMSWAMGMCIDSIDPRILTMLATLILIAYAVLGGVRAITITDVLQFATFMIITALLIKFLFIKTSKSFLEVLLLIEKQEKLQLSSLFQVEGKLFKLVKVYVFAAFFLAPTIIQRVYMAASPIQAYKVFLRVTLFTAIISGCVALIGLLVFVGDPTLLKTAVWPYILVDMPPVYKGYIIISLLGLTMSTADSSLHTAAIMVSNDIVESIRGVQVGSCIDQIRLAKCTTLVTGLLAMIVTIYYPNLSNLTEFVVKYAIGFFTITVAPPFILAIFGFRGSTRTALIGMAIGTLVCLIWNKWGTLTTEIDSGIIAIAANGLAMMAAHYLLPQPIGKGWIGKDSQEKRIRQLIRAFKAYKKSIDLE